MIGRIRIIAPFAAILLLGGISAEVSAAPVLGYAVDTSRDLYVINLQTGSTSLVGHMGAFLEGIALSSSGQLYGTAVDDGFYSIDTHTGVATLIGHTGFADVEGLHFNGNVLLGAPPTLYPQIISIDTTTAQSQLLLTSPQISGGATAMTLRDGNTALMSTFRYGTYGTTYVNELRSIDLSTGQGTVLGTIASGTFVSGLDFGSDGKLYGLDTNGRLLLINPNDATTSVLASTGKIWLDLAAIPAAVPEPTSLLLLAVGTIGVGLRIARSQKRLA